MGDEKYKPMTETERLLHNLVSATANVATYIGDNFAAVERERDSAVKDLAAHLEAQLAEIRRLRAKINSND